MDMLDRIKSSLALNGNISQNVKDTIFDLVVIFNNSFPEINLDNLDQKLKTLSITKLNKFINNDISMYDFRKNILYFNPKEFESGYDAKLVMMYELLNIITSNNYQTGFNSDSKFEALNVGYTSILANYLVGNEGEKQLYPREAVVTNMLSVVVGLDVFKQAYFENNAKLLIEKFMSAGVEV